MPDNRPDVPPVTGGGNRVLESGESGKPFASVVPSQRLRLSPNKDHKPESYEDLQLDFSPSVFSSLERYLPPSMLCASRGDKVRFMREILLKYLPHGDRTRVQRHREYRQKIMSHYQV
uniref:Putative PKHD-type hydroxylase At1g22950 isoform X2 n=1 Tax=Rhizophora mucronata TaxID=61149 RepID=A0A2P2JVM5_RHIMU